MDCLQDYIGLRGCGSSTPGSGLYVNDLPGISLKQIVSLTNEEEATYLDLWAMIQRRAQSRFSLDVREAMGKHYRLKSLVHAIRIPNQYLPTINPLIVGDYAGFLIELEQSGYDYIGSPFMAIQIQELTFKSTVDDTYTFKVFDLDSFQEIYSVSKVVVTGLNNIQINQTFNYRRIAVVVATGNQALFDSNIDTQHQNTDCCDFRFNGIYFTDLDGGYQTSNNTWGLTGIFNVVCTWDNLICQNKNIFARPFWYLTGIELLTEQLYSSKLNQFTTVNLQRAKELREEYQVEYAKAVEQIAGGFSLDCDCCLECAGAVQLRETNQFY